MMSRYRTRESDVVVEVVDLTALTENVLDYANDLLDDDAPEWDKVSAYGGKHAKAYDADGKLFVINTEGVGGSKPVSEEHPVDIEFHASRKGENGGRVGSMLPVASVRLTDSDIEEYPVVEKVKLTEFIREFGSRLENNFDSWNRVLSPAVEEVK
jgi:hypothetical protein